MKIKKIVAVLIILLSLCFIISPTYATENKKTSIYMWEVTGIDYEIYGKMADYLNINKIYAYVGTARLSSKIDTEVQLLFDFAKRKNIDIYVVYDENYEDQTENERRIKEFIAEIKQYNQNSTNKIKGLAIDSEFHCLDGYSLLSKEEQVDLFRRYVNAMKNSYTCAKEANLEYVVCIPVWLNKLDSDLLEELIKDGSDYVQLMNYSKTNMTENIKEEVAFAKSHNKKIENIAEFQIPGPHEVTEDDTFYNEGLEAGINKFKEIDNYYNYDALTFSYHYYKPVIELYKKLNLDDNKEKEQKEDKEDKENNENKEKEENKQEESNKSEQRSNNVIDTIKENQIKNDIQNKINESKIDNTKANGIIPQTGEDNSLFIVLGVIVSIFVGISLIRIKRKEI